MHTSTCRGQHSVGSESWKRVQKKQTSCDLTVSLHRNRTLGAAFSRLLQEAQGGLVPPPSERRLLLYLETLRGAEQEVRRNLPELYTHLQ